MLSLEAFDLAPDKDYDTPGFSAWEPKRIFFNTHWWFYGSREKFEEVLTGALGAVLAVATPAAKGGTGVIPLDTGCANGGRFTALRLEDSHYFRLKCKNKAVPWRSLPMSHHNVRENR